ncbi:MAG TPA: glycosyltransferase 87 family protein [Candidatus Cybelea sp.]|jgi:hypothetical protein
MYDFPDFYCAGRVLNRRESPYTYEPLRTCEHAVNSGGAFRSKFFRANPAIAVPAPLPAYDFVPYMLLARLSPRTASMIDGIAIVAAVAACLIALAALGVPAGLAVAALFLSTLYMELNTGQVVPFALVAFTFCGLALARRRDFLAGILAVLTAIEPSVGLPVTLATFLFVPRARWAIGLASVILAALALRLVGGSTLVQYLSSVLPAQAASEIHFPYQYSLTYLLAFVGVSPDAARVAGAASYLLMLIIGLWIASAASRRLERRELIAFIPALCALIGGTYLHPEELCFAIPALLIMAPMARGVSRVALALALCALAIPWLLVWGSKQLFLASIFVCVIILLRLQIGMRIAFGSLCIIAAIVYALELHPPHLPVPTASLRPYAASELVQDEWRSYAGSRSSSDPLWIFIKLPTWAALLIGLFVAARCAADAKAASQDKKPLG